MPSVFLKQNNLMSKKKGVNKFSIYFKVHPPLSLSLSLTRKITFFSHLQNSRKYYILKPVHFSYCLINEQLNLFNMLQ